jgi:hypothetical protein
MEPTMTTLSKLASDNGELWATTNYFIRVGADNFGYEIVNTSTNAIEMVVEQEPQGVMAMMWLEEAYVEVMTDPEREFKVRKTRNQARSGGVTSGPQSRVIN